MKKIKKMFLKIICHQNGEGSDKIDCFYIKICFLELIVSKFSDYHLKLYQEWTPTGLYFS